MKATEILNGMPEDPTEERSSQVIGAVMNGFIREIKWSAIRAVHGDHSAILYVMSDALAVGDEEDSVRINVRPVDAQKIADCLGLILPTTKIADMIHEQASVVITPCPQDPGPGMMSTSAMEKHSRMVDRKVAGRAGLISTVGKDWVLTNKVKAGSDHAANYGWHVLRGQFKGPGGIPVLQPLGTVHNLWHVDYSQVLRLIHRRMILDGQQALLDDVLKDPALAPLVSYEGALESLRIPDAPCDGELPPPPPVTGVLI